MFRQTFGQTWDHQGPSLLIVFSTSWLPLNPSEVTDVLMIFGRQVLMNLQNRPLFSALDCNLGQYLVSRPRLLKYNVDDYCLSFTVQN